MKKFILNFKQTIRFIVAIITSREFAFLYCVLGTIGQIAHTYYLTNSISSLEGGWRTTQAVMLSIFISSSLLYFTAIADNDDTKESRKIHLAVTLFTVIEILINIYYYSRHLIIEQTDYQIFDFIFAVLVSCLIPITIKLYSSHIRAKEWVLDIEGETQEINNDSIDKKESAEEIISIQSNMSNEMDDIEIDGTLEFDDSNIKENDPEYDQQDIPPYKNTLSEDKVKELINPFIETYQEEIAELRKEFNTSIDPENNTKINEWFENKAKSLDGEISKSFEKNRDLFLTQFENKVKLIIKQKTNEL